MYWLLLAYSSVSDGPPLEDFVAVAVSRPAGN
jgi:hypothetical protein